MQARLTIRRGQAASRTCSSTWPSKAAPRSAPRTTRPKKSLSPRPKSLTRPTAPTIASAAYRSRRSGRPVEREFYKERNVVQEERRMRVDSAPIGRMVEQFLASAYVSHPYRRPGVGWESEISQISATEADAFHVKYYVPSNIVI